MRRAAAAAVCLIATLTSLTYPAAALATDSDGGGDGNGNGDRRTRGIETTFFGGHRSGGAFRQTTTIEAADGSTGNITRDVYLKDGTGFGVAINWEAESDSAYEVAYSRETTTLRSAVPFDLRIEYLQIGGYATFGESRRTIPYFLITVGVARFTPDIAELDAITKLAAAIGGGLKYPITKHLALRFDVRLYAAFFATQANIFCPSTGDAKCVDGIRGTTFVQPDASLGLAVRF